MGRVSGIFAQVRAARLGENTRFPICTHMQHSRNLAQSNHTLNYTVQALIQHSIMQFKVIRMISIWNSSKTVSFPYLLSCLDSFINVNALKTLTPLTPQHALSIHGNITRTIRTYRYDHLSVETHIDDWNVACKRKRAYTQQKTEKD